MKKQIEIPEQLIIPVMNKHNIDREEAVRRIECLAKSGIMKHGNPGDPETQQMIDDFLALDSEEGAAKVLYEKCLDECLHNPDFISSYSRLKNISFKSILSEIESGNPSKKAIKEFKKFSDFVRDNVFTRLQQSI